MDAWFPKVTLGSLPATAAANFGEREALFFEGSRWSFRQLAEEVDRAGRGLMALGIEPGNRVALWLNNRPEWIFLMFAILRIGAVLVPVNARWRGRELGYLLEQSKCTALIFEARSGPVDYLAMVREHLPGLAGGGEEPLEVEEFPHLRRLVVFSDTAVVGATAWQTLLQKSELVSPESLRQRAAAVSPDDLAFLMYTSGTTGFPKGAMHRHAMVRNVVDRINRMGITPSDAIMMFLPLFHLFGFSEGALVSLLSGARQVLTATFDPEAILRLIESERATLAHGFDTHFKELLEAQQRVGADLGSLRSGILAAGMQSSTPIARRAQSGLLRTLSGYGMSEFGIGAALSFLDSSDEQRCEASGYPAPGYLFRIVDPQTGADLPTGEAGEILVKSYAMMDGYFENPAETARALDSAGWLHTGDMGLMRPDGHLRFLGRIKDMLRVGGENVDPMEVEGLLLEHPAVHQVAVVAYPDDRLGEVGVAFVQPAPGHAITPAEVIDHCKGRLAGFKLPRHAIMVEDFPMTASGKIQKAKLRELALEQVPGGRQEKR